MTNIKGAPKQRFTEEQIALIKLMLHKGVKVSSIKKVFDIEFNMYIALKTIYRIRKEDTHKKIKI